MKKSNLLLATVAALFATTNLFSQTGPPETPWILQGNSNVDQSINYLGTTNTQDLVIKTNATQRMVVSGTTGNIGIGVAAPSYPLHIASAVANRSLNIANTTGGSSFKYGVYSSVTGNGTGPKFGGWFEAKNGSGLNYGIKATGNGTGTNYGVNALAQGDNTNYGVYSKALGSLAGFGFNYAIYGEVQANNSNAWAGYFLGRGYFSEKVGIGTTTTTGLLNVYGASTPMAIAIENNYAGAAASYGIYNEMNGAATANKYGFSTKINNGTGNNYGVRAEVNNGNISFGVVGIASGTSQSFGVYGKAEGPGANWGVYGECIPGTNSYGGYFVGRSYFSTNVGIGTSNPAAMLHVDADAATLPMAIQINGASKLKVNTNGSVSVGGVPAGPTDGLYVNGNVAIGTSNPASGYKLSVKGKIICEEMKVQLQTNWPDYVFTPAHNRLSLTELETYINTNKHLPGIPAATEIENNGLAVGDMQVRMMEKIEELTLYVIALEKKINTLENK